MKIVKISVLARFFCFLFFLLDEKITKHYEKSYTSHKETS